MKQFNITGMSCAACRARVEKAVSSVEGVSSCSVSLLCALRQNAVEQVQVLFHVRVCVCEFGVKPGVNAEFSVPAGQGATHTFIYFTFIYFTFLYFTFLCGILGQRGCQCSERLTDGLEQVPLSPEIITLAQKASNTPCTRTFFTSKLCDF